ncbi:MAG TPA: hypothetical protein VEF76_05745, partial [Patescibacteria group bacterium]|nr:hypothetical protein [Patescibacteria group bacterium]
MQNIPDINEHFHAHATKYQGGSIVFLVEQSSPMVNAFSANGLAYEAIIASAAHVRNINPRTRALFFGSEDGLREIDINSPDIPVELSPKSDPKVIPALKTLEREYAMCTSEAPLHVIMVSAGGLGDRYADSMNTLIDLLGKPEMQVMLDVVLVASGPKQMQQMVGVAGSKFLDGGKEKDPAHPAPNLYLAHRVEDIPREIGKAINARIAPENPRQFMLDVMCSIVEHGTR